MLTNELPAISQTLFLDPQPGAITGNPFVRARANETARRTNRPRRMPLPFGAWHQCQFPHGAVSLATGRVRCRSRNGRPIIISTLSDRLSLDCILTGVGRGWIDDAVKPPGMARFWCTAMTFPLCRADKLQKLNSAYTLSAL